MFLSFFPSLHLAFSACISGLRCPVTKYFQFGKALAKQWRGRNCDLPEVKVLRSDVQWLFKFLQRCFYLQFKFVCDFIVWQYSVTCVNLKSHLIIIWNFCCSMSKKHKGSTLCTKTKPLPGQYWENISECLYLLVKEHRHCGLQLDISVVVLFLGWLSLIYPRP